MEPFANNPNNVLFGNLLIFDIPKYLSDPPALTGYLSPCYFIIKHNNNEHYKKYVIHTINETLNEYKETYNKKYKEKMEMDALNPYTYLPFHVVCDIPEMTDVIISKNNPFNWDIISHHGTPPRPKLMTDRNYDLLVRSSPKENHFEINIYKYSNSEFLVEFHNFNRSISAYFDLYRKLQYTLIDGPFKNRLSYLYLYTAYHDEESEQKFDSDYPHIGRFLFNKYGGREICSFLV